MAATPAAESTMLTARDGSGIRSGDIPTWLVFLALTVFNIAIAVYVKEILLSPDIYRQLFGDRLDSATIDQILSMTRETAVAGYLISPLVVWLRVAFFSLMLQFALLIFLIEIPFRRLFRVACWGYFMPLLGTGTQWIVLTFHSGKITERQLRHVPGSIADLMDPAAADSWLYALMSRFNVAEVAFCLVVVIGLLETQKLKAPGAVAVTIAVWLSINLMKWAVMFYLQGLASS